MIGILYRPAQPPKAPQRSEVRANKPTTDNTKHLDVSFLNSLGIESSTTQTIRTDEKDIQVDRNGRNPLMLSAHKQTTRMREQS